MFVLRVKSVAINRYEIAVYEWLRACALVQDSYHSGGALKFVRDTHKVADRYAEILVECGLPMDLQQYHRLRCGYTLFT